MSNINQAEQTAQTVNGFTEAEVVESVTAESTPFVLETNEESVWLIVDNDYKTSKKGIKLEKPYKEEWAGKTMAKAIGAAVRDAHMHLKKVGSVLDSPVVTIGIHTFPADDIKMLKVSYEAFSAVNHKILTAKAVAGNVNKDSVEEMTAFVKGVAIEDKKAEVSNVDADLFDSVVAITIEEVATKIRMNMQTAKGWIQSEESKSFNEREAQNKRVQRLLNKESDKIALRLEQAKEQNRLLALSAEAGK